MATPSRPARLGLSSRGLACGFACVLAACHTHDAKSDRTAVHADLQQRLGTELPLPTTDVDATVDDAVRALLQQPLTATAAVRIALLNNHRVRATYERLAIARADLVQAGLLRNPVFDGDARFLFDGGTELELGLAQPFVDLFHRPLRERLAEHEFAVARLLVTEALVHLVFDVRRAIVHLRAAGRLVALQQDALVAAEAAHQLAVELYAAGNTTDQALALERAGETSARLDLAAAELARLEAREPLQALLGLWGADTVWTLADVEDDPASLAAPDMDRIEARAIAASLDLAAARAGIDALAQAAGLESWRGWLPDGALGVSAVRTADDGWGLGPRLSLELPLFDAGASREARATAGLRRGLHDHTQLAVEVRSTARRLRERCKHLGERERFFREVHLPQRAMVVRTTLQTYNAMQIGVFDVLRQRHLQLADIREHVLTVRDLHLARLDLQQLLAGALPRNVMDTTPPPMLPGSATESAPNRGH